MADVFEYNSGSLFQAIAPEKNLVPVTDEPWVADLDDNFKKAVTADGKVYGAPWQHPGRWGPLQHPGLHEARAEGADDLGRVHGQQREDQGGRHRPGRARPTATPGPRSCSSSADFHNVEAAEPGLRRRVHRTTRPSTRRPGRAGWLRAPAGGVRGRVPQQGLRLGEVRRRRSRRWPPARARSTRCSRSAIADDRRDVAPDKVNDVGFFALPVTTRQRTA